MAKGQVSRSRLKAARERRCREVWSSSGLFSLAVTSAIVTAVANYFRLLSGVEIFFLTVLPILFQVGSSLTLAQVGKHSDDMADSIVRRLLLTAFRIRALGELAQKDFESALMSARAHEVTWRNA